MLCSKTNLLFKISKFSTLLRIILDSLAVNKGLPSVGNKNVMWRQKTEPIGNQQVARGRFNVKAVGMCAVFIDRLQEQKRCVSEWLIVVKDQLRAENVTKQKACFDLQQFEIFGKKLSFNLQCFSVRHLWMFHIVIAAKLLDCFTARKMRKVSFFNTYLVWGTNKYKLHHLKSSNVLPVKIQDVKVT